LAKATNVKSVDTLNSGSKLDAARAALHDVKVSNAKVITSVNTNVSNAVNPTVNAPKVSVNAPKVNVNAPKVNVPTVKTPTVNVRIPTVNVQVQNIRIPGH